MVAANAEFNLNSTKLAIAKSYQISAVEVLQQTRESRVESESDAAIQAMALLMGFEPMMLIRKSSVQDLA